MKDVYKSWSPTFVEGLKYIRQLDEKIIDHPIYNSRMTELFNVMSSEIRLKLKTQNERNDFGAIGLDDIHLYCRRGFRNRPVLDSVSEITSEVLDALKIAPNIYEKEGMAFVLFVAQGEDDDALEYFQKLIRPAVMLYRMREVMHVMGEKGGAPKHQLYREAMKLCRAYRQRHPDATKTAAAKYARSDLKVNNK